MLEEDSNNKNSSRMIIIVLGTLLIIGGIAPYIASYFFSESLYFQDELSGESEVQTDSMSTQIQSTSVATTIVPVELKSKQPKQTLITDATKSETEKSSPALPTLDESDPFFLNEIAPPEKLFVSLDIIRNIVVFVDNFSRGDLLLKFSPVAKPSGFFEVTNQHGITYISDDSYQRYNRYADAVAAIDVDKFIELYTLLSPLFDAAYQEIGYPKGIFSTTFESAITHLLETPIIAYQLEVTSPSVMYRYADENLEALPDTQKLMLRMGPDNLQIIKAKLEQIKDELQRL